MNQILEAAEAIIAQVESIELLHVEADDLEEMTTTTTEADLALLHELIGRFRSAAYDRVRAPDSDELRKLLSILGEMYGDSDSRNWDRVDEINDKYLLQHAYNAYAAASAAEPAEPARVRATDSDEMARLREANFVLRARMHAIALLSSEVSP